MFITTTDQHHEHVIAWIMYCLTIGNTEAILNYNILLLMSDPLLSALPYEELLAALGAPVTAIRLKGTS